MRAPKRQSPNENSDCDGEDSDMAHKRARASGDGDRGKRCEVPGGELHSLLSEGTSGQLHPTCKASYDIPRDGENFYRHRPR